MNLIGPTMAIDIDKLKTIAPPEAMPYKIRRLGHVVLQVSDLERSLVFYTKVLGFKVTELYSEELQPGGFASGYVTCFCRDRGSRPLKACATVGHIR